jgi:hypothetical protein
MERDPDFEMFFEEKVQKTSKTKCNIQPLESLITDKKKLLRLYHLCRSWCIEVGG